MAIEYERIGSESGAARSSTLETNWKRTYVQHWRAITDDPAIGSKTVREGAPVSLGQIYETETESDPGSYCQRITASEDTSADDGRQWIVTAEYSPFDVLSVAPESTFAVRPKLSFGWAEFQKVQEKDFSDPPEPITNSADDPFATPVMQDDAWPLMMITRNEPGYNLNLVAQCKGRINNSPWFGFAPKWWKCLNITSEEAQDQDGSIYFIVTYEFALNPDEWTLPLLDQGFQEKKSTGEKVKILDDHGYQVSEPWPLNEDGSKKAAGEKGEYIVFENHEAIDFSVFGLDAFYAAEVSAGRLI